MIKVTAESLRGSSFKDPVGRGMGERERETIKEVH
jgi:hypothetical protein